MQCIISYDSVNYQDDIYCCTDPFHGLTFTGVGILLFTLLSINLVQLFFF